jgi:hypothetical protein
VTIRSHLLWWFVTILAGVVSGGLTGLLVGQGGLVSLALLIGLAIGLLIGLLSHLPFIIYELDRRR